MLMRLPSPKDAADFKNLYDFMNGAYLIEELLKVEKL